MTKAEVNKLISDFDQEHTKCEDLWESLTPLQRASFVWYLKSQLEMEIDLIKKVDDNSDHPIHGTLLYAYLVQSCIAHRMALIHTIKEYVIPCGGDLSTFVRKTEVGE